MKNQRSVYPMALAAMMGAAAWLGVAWSADAGQSAPGAVNAAQTPELPYGASEVLRMYQGGIGKDVIINYINNTVMPYHLSGDAIMYLKKLGVPQDVTSAMIQRDGQLQQQGAKPGPYGAVAGQQPGQVSTNGVPPPTIIVAGSDDGYGYPYYDYGVYGPYYDWDFGWPVYVGGGWGWWGHGGFHRGFHGGFHGGGFHGGGFHGGFGGGHGGGGGHR